MPWNVKWLSYVCNNFICTQLYVFSLFIIDESTTYMTQGRNKILIIFVLLQALFITATQSQDKSDPNGYNKFYFPNGRISSEGVLKDGRPEGIWKAYHENGRLKSSGNRVNHVLEGEWSFYNDSGYVTAVHNYKNGKKDGLQKEYFENGKLLSEEILADNVRNGVMKFYNQNGLLVKTIPYENGVENGLSKEYADDGRIITITLYDKGYFKKEEKINRIDKFGLKQGTWKEFYPKDKIKTESSFKDDLLHGVYREYGEDGMVTRMEIYSNGRLVEQNKETKVKLEIKRDYYTGGYVKSSVNIRDGVKEGIYRMYDTTGHVIESKLYEKGEIIAEGIIDEFGKEQGPWKFLYPDKSIKAEGNYKDGKRIGRWKFYYKGKILEQEGVYKNGLPEGDWKWYYRSGSVLREETYEAGKEEGLSKEFSESGSLIAEGEYSGGLKDGTWKITNGGYHAVGKYIDGRETGVWVQTFPNGKKAFEGEFADGLPNGNHRFYFSTGRIREERSYKQGLPDGTWKIFDETGELVLTTVYQGGEEQKIDGVKIR